MLNEFLIDLTWVLLFKKTRVLDLTKNEEGQLKKLKKTFLSKLKKKIIYIYIYIYLFIRVNFKILTVRFFLE